jgi:hypothetical protein
MNRRIRQSKAATGAKKRSPSTERMFVQMKSNLFSAVLLSAVLPFAAFAQAPAASSGSAAKTETKTESKMDSTDKGAVKTEKTEKKTTQKKGEKKAAPRHTAAKRPSQKTPAAK